MTNLKRVVPKAHTNADFLYLGFPEDKLYLLDMVSPDVREAVYQDTLRSLMEQPA